MINFIIYENNKKWQEYYKNCILKIIGNNNEKYNIINIEKYTENSFKKIMNLIGKKIYLLDIKVPGKSGLDLARKIRKNNDWTSPIIIITSHKSFKSEGYTSKILMLDFIIKNEQALKNIKESIEISLKICNEQPSFNFTFNNEYYQIPYDNIFYFEKNLNNNYTTIVTKTSTYKIKESITKLYLKFKDIPFLFKTHQSCIININNIKKINFTENLIYFSNCSTNLLSRNKKKELKELISKEEYHEYL